MCFRALDGRFVVMRAFEYVDPECRSLMPERIVGALACFAPYHVKTGRRKLFPAARSFGIRVYRVAERVFRRVRTTSKRAGRSESMTMATTSSSRLLCTKGRSPKR